MNNPSYDPNNQQIARGNSNENDETRSLRWDAAWQPDYDEDYGTPVQQYSGPASNQPLPPLPPLLQPQAPQNPYLQAAQSVPVPRMVPPIAPAPVNSYVQASQGVPVQQTPYAPVTLYQGDQAMPPMSVKGELNEQQSYPGYLPPNRTYNGQPLPPNASPSSAPALGWLIAVLAFFIFIIILVGFSTLFHIFPFWLFFFWPMLFWGRRGRYGSRRWRGPRRW